MQRRQLVDIGANLTDGMFSGVYFGKGRHAADVATVVQRAWDNGVSRVVVTAGSVEDVASSVRLAREVHGLCPLRVYSTVGVHPTRCTSFAEEGEEAVFAGLLGALRDPEARPYIAALGEMGLDYDRCEFCDGETQRRYFERQLETLCGVEEAAGLPLFLHNRNTGADFADVVRKYKDSIFAERPAVSHSFDGSLEQMEELVDLGLYIGINGCSLKTEDNLRVVRAIPPERLLLETDSPYCGIRPSHAGAQHIQTKFSDVRKEKYSADKLVKGRNEPCTLIQVLEVVAAVQERDPEELMAQVFENSCRFFSWTPSPEEAGDEGGTAAH